MKKRIYWKQIGISGMLLCLISSPSWARASPLQMVTPLTTMQGNVLDSSFFQGKPLVLVFWANWCVPCRKEVPFLNTLYQKMAPENVNFLGVNEDETMEQGLAFIQRYAPKYANVKDNSFSWAQKRGVVSLPLVIVLSAKGEELYRGVEPPTLKELQQLIKEQT